MKWRELVPVAFIAASLVVTCYIACYGAWYFIVHSIWGK